MSKKEKLLIVGSDSKWAIESFYVDGLKDFYEVQFFNARGRFLEHYHASLPNKILFRLGLSTFLKKINEDLLKLIENGNYDVVFVFKGMELFPSTIEKIKSKGIYLINYNPDHPFEYFSRGSGNENVLNSIQLFDHHFSYSKKIVSDLKSKFGVSASWLPFAYAYAEKPLMKDEQYNKLCFIGNPDKRRAKVIKKLLEHAVPIDVYGNHWSKFLPTDQNMKINKAVYGEEFVKQAKAYRLQLNIFRPHNLDSHNMRTFEMPAIGCLSLAPRSAEQVELFSEGEEAFYYKDDTEMISQAKNVLALSKDQAFDFKFKAYSRCVNEEYHYNDRSKKIHQFLQKR